MEAPPLEALQSPAVSDTARALVVYESMFGNTEKVGRSSRSRPAAWRASTPGWWRSARRRPTCPPTSTSWSSARPPTPSR